MSVKTAEYIPLTVKEKCVRCLKGPNLIRSLIILVCFVLVVEQLTSCVQKIISIPITTYTHFEFNKTLLYPSLTFCREPPFKYNQLAKYGMYVHPYYTSTWRNFDFDNVSLDEFWEDVTYKQDDIFVIYGLDQSQRNIVSKSVDSLKYGRCYTLEPSTLVTSASKTTGYSITLQHSVNDFGTFISLHPPGYHVFIHYKEEPFTEIEVHNAGLIDYLYIHAGEEIDVKLSVDQYFKLSDDDDPCTDDKNYSANLCATEVVGRQVGAAVGCSGPWMQASLPRCNNYTAMKRLISDYMHLQTEGPDFSLGTCPRFCLSYLYNAFVVDRQRNYWWDGPNREWAQRSGEVALQTQMFIHFNSMMVSFYEERYNYDWNLFLSDLGGSVGFLLGLSVVSLMTIFGKVFSTVKEVAKSSKSTRDASSVANSTVKMKDDDDKSRKDREADYVKKCKEWNARNDRLVT